MRILFAFLCLFVVGSSLFAAPVQIDVTVRILEVCERVSRDADGSLPTIDERMQLISSASDVTNILSYLNQSGEVSLLSAPRLTVESGSNATIKVCSEYIYPTDIDVRYTSITNGKDVVKSVSIVPCNYEKFDAGVMLNVTPIYRSQDDTIDLTFTARVSALQEWTHYTSIYKDTDGEERKYNMELPLLYVRETEQRVVIGNNMTFLAGGMTTMKHFKTVDKVPILGYIPLLGRLFRSVYEGDETVNLVLVVTAKKR
jgi:type II secretory pathway component GspD/PulD (secretin)